MRLTRRTVSNPYVIMIMNTKRPMRCYALIPNLAILCLLGCSSEVDPLLKTTLNRGLNGDPETLHPHLQQSNQSSQVIRDIYEGLLVDDGSGNLEGGIAESFTVSSDGLIYEFRLRSSARWSDGHPIQGSDIVRSFRCLADPSAGSTNSSIISSVLNAREVISGSMSAETLGISALSERVVQIRMAQADSVFPHLLTLPGASIVYTDPSLDKVCRQDVEFGDRIFSGAYKLVTRDVGSMIELKRNEYYWNAKRTGIESVIYHIVDPDSEINRFRAKELDVTANVPASFFRRAKDEFRDELKVSPFLGVYYIGINFAEPRLGSDLNLRAALFHAIDRAAIVEKVLARGERPAEVWVHPEVNGYYSNLPQSQDSALDSGSSIAQTYFRQSQVSGDAKFSLSLRYNSGGGHEQIMLAIQSMWAKNLGLTTNLRKEEWKVFLSNLGAGSGTELFRLSWTADYNDALAFLEIFQSGHEQNLIQYSNDEFDDLLRRSRRELSSEKRNLLLTEAEKVLLADYAVIPVYFYVAKHLVSTRVDGWTNNPMDIHRTKDLRIVGLN